MNINFNSNIPGNFKVKRQKFGIGSLILMLGLGVVFIISGFLAMNNIKIDPGWTRINGEVIEVSSSIAGSDGSTTYTPTVKYAVDGQEYRVTSSSGSSSYPNIGDKRQVAYNPTNPAQSKVVEGNWVQVLLWLFMAVGMGILIFAPIAFVRSKRRSGNIQNLMQTGQKLQGILTDIQSFGNRDNNNSYKIVVTATNASGAVQNYVSDSLTGIGGLAMADFRQNPIPIDVYIDPANPQNYYVDVSDIPNLTPERIGELIKSAINKNQPQSIVNPLDGTTPPGSQPPVFKP